MTKKTRRKIQSLIIEDNYNQLKNELRKRGLKGEFLKKEINKTVNEKVEDCKNMYRETGEISYLYEIMEHLKFFKATTKDDVEKKYRSTISAFAVIQAARIGGIL